jgi:protein phosphatase
VTPQLAKSTEGREAGPVALTAQPSPPEWAALSDQGLVRENNEDAWGAFALDAGLAPLDPVLSTWPLHGLLLVMSDGMGGARAGERASRFCVERLGTELHARIGLVEAGAALREAILATHAGLTQLGASNPEWKGMGATLSALWLQPGGAVVLGHVGDSRIYFRHEGKWRQWTEDHTLGEGLVRRGGLTPEAAARFRFRSLLEQVMGADGRSLDPQIETATWQAGDAFALCCDGLYRPLERRLEELLTAAVQNPSLPDGARQLVEAANAAGGPDNITVLLVGGRNGKTI